MEDAYFAGDLTPMNILITETDGRFQAKLIDFGLSKSKISKSSKVKAGTPSYKPPENGLEPLSGAVDVFGFGGVLIYLFGEEHVHPFDDLDDDAISNRMMYCYKEKMPLNIPELETIEVDAIREIASECFRTDAGLRPTASELLEKFNNLCGLSNSTQIGNATEDAMMKAQMRMLNVLMEEVALLKTKMEAKDMIIDDMDVRMQFLMGQYMDSV